MTTTAQRLPASTTACRPAGSATSNLRFRSQHQYFYYLHNLLQLEVVPDWQIVPLAKFVPVAKLQYDLRENVVQRNCLVETAISVETLERKPWSRLRNMHVDAACRRIESFACDSTLAMSQFWQNAKKIPRWQVGVTGGLLLWAAALQVCAAPFQNGHRERSTCSEFVAKCCKKPHLQAFSRAPLHS